MTTYHEHVAKAPEIATVEFESPPDSEAVALRIAPARMQQDSLALQKALARMEIERDQWRNSYLKITRERP